MDDEQIFDDLNEPQALGVSLYQLSMKDVQAENFGYHTLTAIDDLIEANLFEDKREAFAEVEGLDEYQAKGVSRYELSRKDVQTKNFGSHTLDAIEFFKRENLNLRNKVSFLRVKDLDAAQAKGVTFFHLRRKDVETKNFGRHTLNVMKALKKKNLNMSNEEAFAKVKGLDEHQAKGVYVYKLSGNQVYTKNFGRHTLVAIAALKRRNRTMSDEAAFTKVEGLDANQARGVYHYQLNRNQVENTSYNQDILKTMDALHKYIPGLEGLSLYETQGKRF